MAMLNNQRVFPLKAMLREGLKAKLPRCHSQPVRSLSSRRTPLQSKVLKSPRKILRRQLIYLSSLVGITLYKL